MTTINILNVERSYVNAFSLPEEDILRIFKQNEPFINLIQSTHRFPTKDSIPEVILNNILNIRNITLLPELVADLGASANDYGVFYLPSKVPNDTMRLVIPRRTKCIINDRDDTFFISANQTVDCKSMNNIPTKNYLDLLETVKFMYYHNHKLSSPKPELKFVKPSYELTYIKLNKDLQSFSDMIKKQYKFPFTKFVNIESFYNLISRLDLKQVLLDKMSWSANQKILDANKYNTDLYLKRIQTENYNILLKNIAIELFSNKNINFKQPYKKIKIKLSKQEVEKIESVYNTRANYKKAYTNNTCPHVAIMKKLNSKITPHSIKELEKYISNPGETKSMYLCNNCKFEILCPHRLTEMKMLIKTDNITKVIDSITDYIITVPSDLQYYHCKVCYDTLKYPIDDNFDKDIDLTVYPQLRARIYSRCLNLYSFIKFDGYINIINFAYTTTADILRVLIKTDIKNIRIELKSFFNTSEISDRLNLYIWLYTYAYILNLIKDSIINPSKKKVKVRLNAEIKGNNLSNYAEKIKDHILTNRRGLLSLIKDFELMSEFKEIFAELSTSGISYGYNKKFDKETELLHKIFNSIHFRYVYNIASAYKNLPPIGSIDSTIEEYENAIRNVIGDDKFLDKTFVNIISNIPIVESNSKNKDYLAYKEYHEWFNDKNRKIDGFKEVQDLFKEWNTELNLKYKIASNNMASERKYNYSNSLAKTNILSLIAPDGNIIEWDTPIIKDGKIIDFASSKYNITRNTKVNDDKLLVAYKNKEIYDSLFSFYIVICPEGNLHTFENNKCTKCGYGDGMNKDKYFDKYKNKYLKPANQVDLPISKFIQPVNTTTTMLPIVKKKPEWIFDIKPIDDIAVILKIPTSVFLNFGLTHNYTYENLMRLNSDNIVFPKLLNSPQISIASSLLYEMANIYNKIIYRNLKTPKYLTIVNKYKDDIYDLIKTMDESLPDKYVSIIDDFKKLETPENIYKYIIQSICSFGLNIININPKKEFYKDIFKYIFDIILEDQFNRCIATTPNILLLQRKYDNTNQIITNYDQIEEESVDKEDLQMFVNETEYTGYNDSNFE